MAKNHIDYVKQRNGVYQYVRRVPASVIADPQALAKIFDGKKVFRKSLKTKDKTEAFASASIINQQFDKAVENALAKSGAEVPATSTLRPPNVHDCGLIAKTVRDRMYRFWGPRIINAAVNDDADDELQWQLEKEIEDIAKDEKERSNGSRKATDIEITETDEIIAEFGLDAAKGTPAYAMVLSAVREGKLEGRKGVQDMFDDKFLPSDTNSTLIKKYDATQPIDGKPRLLSEVMKYQDQKSDYSPKTLAKRARSFQAFQEVNGDQYIHAIERKNIIDFVEEISGRNVGNTGRPVSAQTVQSYISPISSAIDYAISHNWRDGPNPAASLKIESFTTKQRNTTTPDKQRFHDYQLKELFSHPWFSGCESLKRSNQSGKLLLNDSRFWVPIVALYTGTRAAELGGLKITDVKFQPVPHFIIQANEYRGVKSGEKRLVPLLDALQNLGFVEYLKKIEKSGADRVFPDWIANRTEIAGQEVWQWANGNIIRAFNRSVVKKLFPIASKETRSPLSFHSLRGSFKKLMYETNQIVLADQVIGHKMEKLNQRYLGSFDIVELYQAFHKLNYDNVEIPHRTSSNCFDPVIRS